MFLIFLLKMSMIHCLSGNHTDFLVEAMPGKNFTGCFQQLNNIIMSLWLSQASGFPFRFYRSVVPVIPMMVFGSNDLRGEVSQSDSLLTHALVGIPGFTGTPWIKGCRKIF